MTDVCVGQQTPQEDGRKCVRGHEERDYHSDVENGAEERHRWGRMASESLQTDPEQLELSGRRKPALVRSKTSDNCLLTQVHTDLDSKIERKKCHCNQLSKSNCQYHKIFKEISKEEQLRQSYTCALQKDILYQGRMFVSGHWICFHSKVFGKDTKIAIPVTAVTNIKKTKTALLVPNALVIATANDRYVFVSFLSRDNTYKFLMSVCLHLEEKSPCNSPIPSSAENSFRGQRSPHSPRFPLSFVGEYGALRERQHELEESSSSDSQTPDYEKIADFAVPPFLNAMKCTDSQASPEQAVRQHHVKKQQQNQQQPDNKQHVGDLDNRRTLKVFSLNTLLYIYLFLVCVLVVSSCYLAFKIISLEKKLTSLGSVAEFTNHGNSFLQGSADMNTELFSELLSVNLMKLEKVQKNLQRLLDEAA